MIGCVFKLLDTQCSSSVQLQPDGVERLFLGMTQPRDLWHESMLDQGNKPAHFDSQPRADERELAEVLANRRHLFRVAPIERGYRV